MVVAIKVPFTLKVDKYFILHSAIKLVCCFFLVRIDQEYFFGVLLFHGMLIKMYLHSNFRIFLVIIFSHKLYEIIQKAFIFL